MSAAGALSAVEAFFGKWGQAGLLLPDGWFGRPYDNLYLLSEAVVDDDGLKIDIPPLRLRFSADVLARESAHDLTMFGFSTLLVAGIETGTDLTPRTFQQGECVFRVW